MRPNLEDTVLEAFFDMYKERCMPVSAKSVAVRVGCTRATALRHLRTNQERLSSNIGWGGEWFFAPKYKEDE